MASDKKKTKFVRTWQRSELLVTVILRTAADDLRRRVDVQRTVIDTFLHNTKRAT